MCWLRYKLAQSYLWSKQYQAAIDEFRIRVTKDPGSAPVHMLYNHVSFPAGYASSSAGPTHFGLGRNKSADLAEIRWPSGINQQLKDVPADQIVKVKEPPR